MNIVKNLSLNQKKFLLVSIYYFSKWIETEALATITEEAVIKFMWKALICRYGIPCKLISNNGWQFQGHKIKEWCQELGIIQSFTYVAYSQSNSQVKVINQELVRGLNVWLDRCESNWVEELLSVL